MGIVGWSTYIRRFVQNIFFRSLGTSSCIFFLSIVACLPFEAPDDRIVPLSELCVPLVVADGGVEHFVARLLLTVHGGEIPPEQNRNVFNVCMLVE